VTILSQRARVAQLLALFVGSAVMLSLIGLVFIYEASSILAGEQKNDAAFYLKRQAKGLVIGIVIAIAVSMIPLRILQTYAGKMFWLALCITLVPLIFSSCAVKIHGSTRWLSLGGHALQPSELMKVLMVPCIASYITDKDGVMLHHSARSLIIVLFIAACAAVVFLSQPDFGQAALVMLTVCCIGLITYQYPVRLFLLAIPLALIAGMLIVIQPYRLKRIMTFLRPWDDPQGSGFQIIQSLIAIGSGGWGGRGIAQSQQKYFYLPMQHTDFIFAIIAEEMGLIGSCCVIGLYAIVLYAGVQLALRMRNMWASMTILGQTILISLQALMNLAVATGMAPTKGIGLPFLSYGVSSLLACSCMIGIVIACVRHHLNYSIHEHHYAASALKYG